MRGAIYYPRWRIAACLMRPWDAMLGRLTTFGAPPSSPCPPSSRGTMAAMRQARLRGDRTMI
jgi:hypothetical protein